MNPGKNTLPTYDSMAACVGATGIPMGILKMCKKSGCPAFLGSRVSLEPLLRWFFSRDPDSEAGVNWTERGKRIVALRGELAYSRELHRSWDAVEVQDAIAAGVAAFFRAMEQGFDPLPAKLLGLDQVAIKAALDAVQAQMRTAGGEVLQALIGDEK